MSLTAIQKYKHLKKKMTKYRIAKETGLSLNTLNMWDKEVFKPNEDSAEKIDKLFKETP